MEAGKTLDIVRTEADVVQLVSDVHCIIAAMMGSSTEVRGWAVLVSVCAPGCHVCPSHLLVSSDLLILLKHLCISHNLSLVLNSFCSSPNHKQVCLLHPDLLLSVEHIVCDPDRVRGVLLNLYTNAAKFTKTGHIGMRVSLCGVCGGEKCKSK